MRLQEILKQLIFCDMLKKSPFVALASVNCLPYKINAVILQNKVHVFVLIEFHVKPPFVLKLLKGSDLVIKYVPWFSTTNSPDQDII